MFLSSQFKIQYWRKINTASLPIGQPQVAEGGVVLHRGYDSVSFDHSRQDLHED